MRQESTGFDLHGLTLAVVVGVWLVGMILNSLVNLPPPLLLSGVGIALISFLLLWQDRKGRFLMLLICCLLAGAWRHSIALPDNNPQAISLYISNHPLKIQGAVSEEPRLRGRSRQLVITVSKVSTDGGISWQDAYGQIAVTTRETLIETPYGANYGAKVELQGKLQAPTKYQRSGIFATMDFPRISLSGSEGNPIIASLYHLRITLAQAIERSLPQPHAALLTAVSLSIRTPALKLLNDDFKITGTAHLLTASGSNVTILAGLLRSMVCFPASQFPQGSQQAVQQQRRRQWQQWLVAVLTAICIMAYTFLCGAGAAVLRAGCMGILLIMAPHIGRMYNVYTALALAALLMSALDPFTLWDIGFQLSFAGTLGIVLLTPFFQRLLHPIKHLPFGHYIAESLAVTMGAQVATQPIFVVSFQEISLISPLANILTTLMFGPMLVLGIFISGSGAIFAPLGEICGWVAWPLLWYVASIVSWCASIPGASIYADGIGGELAWAYYALLVLLTSILVRMRIVSPALSEQRDPPLLRLPQRTWHLILLGAALLIILATGGTILVTPPAGHLTVTFLCVGPAKEPPQGKAVLLRTPDGKTILIDGGPDIPSLARELDRRLPPWQRSLDMVLLTAAMADSITGLQDIVSRYRIETVIDAGMLHPTTTYTLWRRTISERNIHYLPVTQGTTLPIGTSAVIQVLWPPTPLHKGDDEIRDNGLVVRLVTPGLRVLLLGATTQSKYALTGLLARADMLQAEVVQIVGEVSKPYPDELRAVLQKVRPALLVITPASLNTQQLKISRAAGLTAPVPPLVAIEAVQIAQTGQGGTLEISSSSASLT